MTGQTGDDEARWAEALSLLELRPTESADRRLRRANRNRLLLIVAFVLVGLVAGVVVATLVLAGGDGGPTHDAHVPTWLRVLGLSVSGLGVVVMLVGGVVLFRRLRGTRGWHSPLNVLTFRQRRELLAQLRGRAPVVPERAPLVGHLAEVLLAQRVAFLPQVGLLLNFAGLWIADRSTWRLVGVVLLSVVLVAAAWFGRREADRARRFLDQHPVPAAEPDRG